MGSTPKYPSFDDGSTYWLTGKTLNAIFKAIKETTPLEGKNVRLRQKADGIQIDAEGGGEASLHPYYVTVSGGVAIVEGGSFNGIPSVMSESYAIGGGLTFIYLQVQFDLMKSADFVYAGEFLGSTVMAGASLPSDNTTNGIYYLAIAAINAGVKTAQYVINSLSGQVCDSGMGDGSANLVT